MLTRIIKEIPSPHRECFGFLITFLREVAQAYKEKDRSRVSSNLASIFVVPVMGSTSGADIVGSLGQGSIILTKLLTLPIKMPTPSMETIRKNTWYKPSDYEFADREKYWSDNEYRRSRRRGSMKSAASARSKVKKVRKKTFHREKVRDRGHSLNSQTKTIYNPSKVLDRGDSLNSQTKTANNRSRIGDRVDSLINQTKTKSLRPIVRDRGDSLNSESIIF